jgi:hypothetical protein
MSASEDIRILQLDAIAETAELVEMYGRHASNFASIADDEALEWSLRCMVKCVNATLATWREMRSARIGASSGHRRAA